MKKQGAIILTKKNDK